MNDNAWAQLQAEQGGHFLQGVAWGEFQRGLGREVVRAAGEGWSYQGMLMQGRGGIRYLYCPYGPTVRDAAGLAALASLWTGQRSVDFVRCEPMGAVDSAQLRESALRPVAEVQPQHTLVIDLTQDEDALRKGLSSGHRNAVNGAERRGLSFRAGALGDLKLFLQFIHATAERTGFRPHPDHYFETMMAVLEPLGAAKLFVAEHDGRPVAAAIAYDYAGTRFYAHAASDPEARKLQVAAPLVWHMAWSAREQGMQAFDLWGIAPEGAPASHPWAGFTQFKRAFGGVEHTYAGTWELPVRPGKYRLYALAKRLGGRA